MSEEAKLWEEGDEVIEGNGDKIDHVFTQLLNKTKANNVLSYRKHKKIWHSLLDCPIK